MNGINREFKSLNSKVRRVIDLRIGTVKEAQRAFERMRQIVSENEAKLQKSVAGRKLYHNMHANIEELAPLMERSLNNMHADSLIASLRQSIAGCLQEASAPDLLSEEGRLDEAYEEAEQIAEILDSPRYVDAPGQADVLSEFRHMQETVAKALSRSFQRKEIPGMGLAPAFGMETRPGSSNNGSMKRMGLSASRSPVHAAGASGLSPPRRGPKDLLAQHPMAGRAYPPTKSPPSHLSALQVSVDLSVAPTSPGVSSSFYREERAVPVSPPGAASAGFGPYAIPPSRTMLDRLRDTTGGAALKPIELYERTDPVASDKALFSSSPRHPSNAGFLSPALHIELASSPSETSMPSPGVTTASSRSPRVADEKPTATVKTYSPVSKTLVSSPITRLASIMPPLLDRSRVTLGAANPLCESYHTAIDRIGSYLSPQSGNATFDSLLNGRPIEPLGLPAGDGADQGFTDDDMARFRERYMYYALHEPAETVLADFPDYYVTEMLRLVPDRAPLVSDAFVDEVLRDTASGMRETYIYAVRKATLDYVLQNPAERRRLGILAPPVPFSTSVFAPDFDVTRHSAVAASLARDLMLLDPVCQEILRFFEQTFTEGDVLLDVSPAAIRKYPLDVASFCKAQKTCAESLEQTIRKKRIPVIVDMLRQKLVSATSAGDAAAGAGVSTSPSAKSPLRPLRSAGSPPQAAAATSAGSLSEDQKARLVGAVSAMLFTTLRKVMERSVSLWQQHLQHTPRVFSVSLAIESAEEDASGSGMALALSPSPDILVDTVIDAYHEMCSSLNATAAALKTEFPAIFAAAGGAAGGFDGKGIGSPNAAAILLARKALGPQDAGAAVVGRSEMSVGDAEDAVVSVGRLFLENILDSNIEETLRAVSVFSEYLWLVDGSAEAKIKAFLASEKGMAFDFEAYEELVVYFRDVGEKLMERLPSGMAAGAFSVNCVDVKFSLHAAALRSAISVLDFLAVASQTLANNICKSFEDMESAITRVPKTAEDFVSMQDYFRKIKHVLDEQDKQNRLLKQRLRFLVRVDYSLSDSQISSTALALLWPDRIKPIVEEGERKMETYREKFDAQLDEKVAKFERELDRLLAQAQGFKDYSEWREHGVRCQEIDSLYKALEECEKKVPFFNEQESLLNRMRSPFSQIAEARKVLDPYTKVWRLAHAAFDAYDLWMNGEYTKFAFEDIDRDAQQYWRDAVKMLKTLGEMPQAAHVIEKMKETFDVFKKFLPVLAIVSNPGMRDRHWRQVSDLLKVRVHPSEQPTLAIILKLDLLPQIAKLEEISTFASKEYMLERSLDSMSTDWQPMQFSTTAWRESGTHILSAVDEIQQLLDDHLVKTQTMRCSPFIGPFEERAKVWEQKLVLLQDILDAWLKVQATWLYLESIFSSPDIQKQMPVEDKMFKTVDKVWRDTMAAVRNDSSVLSVTSRDGTLQKLQECNALLDQIQAGLNQYLETKRLYFPRFFFLSNDELLEILSETKDPLRIQPHLKKCFEGIAKLKFEPNLDITAMVSSEGEVVQFDSIINPTTAEGAVEKWLVQVEDVMKSSLRRITRQSVEDFAASEHFKWVLKWPGQVVICTDQIYWTREVTAVLEAGEGAAGLHRYVGELNGRLSKILELVRGDLSSLDRETLGALVVISVHAKDVVEVMATKGISDANDFEWLAQLRYYLDDATTGGLVKVRMINASIDYGYEYLGNTGRLVITPLTDRCYRTLMGALHLNLGGAPEGPAGTGKTETTKDLAKAIAKQCVVFNCSDGLDYLAMGKFFKGLASSGAWACFDEFNRIDLEVLSVVAQQILTIQRARAAYVESFVFEGTQLRLDRSCAVFITMNPGYAGRSELPDNLKALFRPVAMMVPNYALIAEISLYSFGFIRARPLSHKIVAVYKLCSEQLSSQDHYDYGMRAVKAVLTAAGNLKRRFPNENEDLIVLRSIVEVNLPKFLSQDIPLFRGITSDLFPGVSLPEPDYYDLINAIHENIRKMSLQPVPIFIDKILQLYDVICVRHGLMVVGFSFAGKTAAYRVLAAALGDLCEAGSKMNEQKTQVHILNPKSIHMGNLYGRFDPVSHEWSDGILAKTFRSCASDPSPDRKWIMFDGPVDAVWIENMNTVLDDNKKLCLMSGEIIQMSRSMNMIFEVQDLAVASPATVSRCGMIYMEPVAMGWQPLFKSWCALRLPTGIQSKPPMVELVEGMASWLIPPVLSFLRKECTEPAPTSDINLVRSLTNIYESLIYDEVGATDEALEKLSERDLTCRLENFFLFSLVWSIGAAVDTKSRPKFDAFLRRVLNSDTPDPYGSLSSSLPRMLTTRVPAKDMLFDYVCVKNEWTRWQEQIPAEFKIPNDASFSEILVPTVDTVRYSYLLQVLLKHQKPVMFCGPTGTGKSVYIKDVLLNKLDSSVFTPIFVNFSAQTTAGQTQNIIDGKLDKRRKGIFGPPLGKQCVAFVDDVNMPTKEVYGAQPPIELLRQFLDHGGWYDLTDNSFRSIVDVQLVTAMGPPGGGRNQITPRFMRHFNFVSITEFDDGTLQRIFSEILNWFFRTRQFQGGASSCVESIVGATRDIYQTAIAQLLPTPNKSHYLFNLRDFGRVVQGILLSSARYVTDRTSVLRVWTHEVLRVFGDRLVTEEDSSWLLSYMKDCVKKYFQEDFNAVFVDLAERRRQQQPGGAGGAAGAGGEDAKGAAAASTAVDTDLMRSLLYGDYLDPNAGDRRTYREVTDFKRLQRVMEGYLEDFNQISKKPMSLVLFPFAIEHVSRVCRILRQPGGHALLVGVGGSGRQSLTRLAAHIGDFELVQVEITSSYAQPEWREDLKKLVTRAGAQGQGTVFLFTDSQIKKETFLEDINNLLNTGEVPNLFASDERAQIIEMTRSACKNEGKPIDGTPAALFNVFVERVRRNLHIVLCMSPIGDAFRNRLRMFPSLVNCCTIDWFRRWPEDALEAVAVRFLEDVDMSKADRRRVVDMCKSMHESVIGLSNRFRIEQGRHNYVTPTSYLGLISSYKDLLARKKGEVTAVKDRYENGLEKLLFTAKQVKKMQQDLEALKPKLIKAGAETEELMRRIDKEATEVNKTREIVMRDEAAANAKAMDAKAIKDDCEADLSKAIPIMKAALSALDTLTSNDISLVKSMKNPPPGVKLVMTAVCIMKNIKPNKVNDPATGKKTDDYWTPSMKLLGDTGFLSSLKTYDKDNVDPVIEKMVKKDFMDNPEFDPDKVRNASSAAEGLCKWVRAVIQYSDVMKIVKPKQAALEVAESEYNETMEGLKAKRAELKAVEDRMAQLQKQLDETIQRKKQLEADVDDCTAKLDRAQKLIGGLGGEKDRWAAAAKQLDKRIRCLTGDVLISAGLIAYLGAFTVAYRNDCVASWIQLAQSLEIPRSETIALSDVLGDAVKIRAWHIDGLPKDSFSTDNGIITSNAKRWPLMIDPEGQANKWIRNMERGRKLICLRLTDNNFLRTLENAVRFGTPVLLENVGEELDPSLEPLLLRQTFKQGGVPCIRLGDSTVEYSEDFRLYITTKLRNPHYLPELSTKVTLINFMITLEGLEDQLLGTVVAQERPELEDEKNDLIMQSAANKKQLQEIEDKILEVLSSSKGNILEDSSAIEILSASKEVSTKIEKKQKIAEETEAKIDAARIKYQPVAVRSSVLFFCIASLANIDPMYQYSLSWFINLFLQSIANSEKSSDLDQRLVHLNKHFTYSLYCNVCRSLFEKDKLLFSLLLCTAIMNRNQELVANEWRFLLTGGVSLSQEADPRKNPAPQWLSEKSWNELLRLNDTVLSSEVGLAQHVANNLDAWLVWYDSPNPHEVPLPLAGKSLTPLQSLLIVRCLRPDKIVPAVFAFVQQKMGSEYVTPPGFDLSLIFQDSTPVTPLIFILSPGSDPMNELLRFADTMKMGEKLESISLGQGQGPIAERLIQNAMKTGSWVVLQNCHLAVSWMTTLERICENINPDTTNPNFRLWLTSYPSDRFPLSVLQSGVKMTNEPPKGLRANLLRSYTSDPINDAEFYESCGRPDDFHKLLFGLCFFHALVQERRKFGPIGFNIPYEFNETDLRISARQLHMFLNEAGEAGHVPFAALSYLAGECNYGGRVTDDWDRRCLMSILSIVYNPQIVAGEGALLSASGTYHTPEGRGRDAVLKYIESLPSIAAPEVFGMHGNADITKNINDTQLLFSTILITQGSGGGKSKSGGEEATVDKIAETILAKLPKQFDVEAAQRKYPVRYEESMNTVLCQELIRFNKLTAVIRSSLENLRKAIKGLVVMSSELESVLTSLFNGAVPALWEKASYPSRKPLSSYVSDLLSRLSMFSRWVQDGPPMVFWLSGFYFTQSFLTGVLQNYARKYTIPIDTVSYDIEILPSDFSPAQRPEDGCYINGLFLEGAQWDDAAHLLAQSKPKVLYSQFPTIWLRPTRTQDIKLRPGYMCPLYRTLARRGVLATTGHSTNFVMPFHLPTDQSPDVWIRNGVALFLALDD